MCCSRLRGYPGRQVGSNGVRGKPLCVPASSPVQQPLRFLSRAILSFETFTYRLQLQACSEAEGRSFRENPLGSGSLGTDGDAGKAVLAVKENRINPRVTKVQPSRLVFLEWGALGGGPPLSSLGPQRYEGLSFFLHSTSPFAAP